MNFLLLDIIPVFAVCSHAFVSAHQALKCIDLFALSLMYMLNFSFLCNFAKSVVIMLTNDSLKSGL